jgi:Cu(I)/Ag(I) efflux system membrane fusion protein
VLAGLEEGQMVVVSGQFLLDSEASLQGIAVQALAMPREHAITDLLHYAEAVVEQIADGKIKLKHGPFETLGMPGMTMRFRLADEQVASGISEGDRVRVGVSDSDAGLIVESLEKQEIAP